ncbi:Beta-barrel assembly machine subunit BamA [Rubritalea squalenifaciens DSM 18772]|uniref:Beta-barrel assembly machine subunit BamA n=1 Tax=Rubritalea squalenifaciens DSM 18772 TaxID=1123071 RepID=A0A1M6ERL4_9BACT|nr:BamA/TamA family outer membrane protein [Rubritalea squalenifaciens]SHI88063.1 Beta-barrel assembly machine subunit BamA [Rubritalea squalenifaciens DSM 18772]
MHPRHIPIYSSLLIGLSPLALKSAEIRVTGLAPGQQKEIIDKLTPRLDFVTRREPSPWRADDAAFFLKRILVRAGHAEATVDWSLPGGQIIQLTARPGIRYVYGEINTNELGPLTQEELRSYFLQPVVESEIVKEDEAPYIPKFTALGAQNVDNYLKSQGYWSSSVTVVSEQYDRQQKDVDITLRINPGPVHILAVPSFQGAKSEDIQAHLADIKPYLGKTANTENITKVRTAVEEYYRKKGFHFAKLTMSSKHRADSVRLTFTIDRGLRYKVEDIRIAGNKKTKTKRIRRFFDDLKGEYYDAQHSDEILRKALSTGAFRRVTVTPVPQPDAMLDLEINVEEAKAKSIRSYLGLGTFEGGIAGLSYTDLNFNGELLRFNARGELSGRGFLGETSLTEPFFLGEPLSLTVRAFTLQRLYDAYDKFETGGEISLTWSPKREYSTRLYLGGSYVTTSSSDLTPLELGPDDYVHTKLGIIQSIDFRDNTTLPSEGFHGQAKLETGTVAGDSTTSYVLANIDTSYRIRQGERNHFIASFSTGAIRPGDSADLPIDLRLFSGGADSVRSFDEREMGPRSFSNDPLGGEAYWNASLEYVRDIREPIRGVVFFDMGQVYSDISSWGFNNPSYAVGLGMRIDLPIGPIRLEYGHNLNRKDGEPAGTLHFAIGATF